MRNYFLMTLIVVCAIAQAEPFSDGVNFANNGMSNAKNIVSQFNPNQFKDYTNNPSETQYYQGGKSDSQIKSAIPNAMQKNSGAQSIENNFSKDQAYQINKNAPEIQKANLVEADSYNITHGISDQYVQCVKKEDKKDCKISFIQKICTGVKQVSLSCHIIPVVSIDTVPYQAIVTYTGNISPQDQTSGTFSIPESGTVQSFSMTMKSPNIWRCDSNYQGYLNNQYLSTYYPSCGRNLGDLSFSNTNLAISVSKNDSLSFHIQGPTFGNWSSANYSITVLVTRYKQVANVAFQNSCGIVPSICALSNATCKSPGGTKIFNGVNIDEPCWDTENDYLCGPSDDHSCDALLNSGCSSISIKCINTFNNICIQYQNTLTCPVKTCQSNEMICGDNAFCTDGNCYQSKASQNQNFGKDEAQLAAAASSADSVSQNQDTLSAFSGNSMSCSMAPIGFLNCCADSGWGKDIGLAGCTNDEKKLGQIRQNGEAIYVGEYCSYHILGVCTAHRKSFCTFNGLLATDVQTQGRFSQLGIGFGNAKNPDCRGLSVSELQKIDFSKIDFSNLEQSLQKQANFPNNQAVQQYIANKIKEEVGGK